MTQTMHNKAIAPTHHERWRGFAWVGAFVAVAASAIVVKQLRVRPQPLLGVAQVSIEAPAEMIPGTQVDVVPDFHESAMLGGGDPESLAETSAITEAWFVGPPAPEQQDPDYMGFVPDPTLRWFNARPVRPVRVIWMTVTAYSPDPRSCGDSADGITATLHSVMTNAHRLVAADPKILNYGTILSVPGYAEVSHGEGANVVKEPTLVPVLDCGSKIKGYKLDVLYPTHEEAMKWGKRVLPVTVWEYADGKGAGNVRKDR